MAARMARRHRSRLKEESRDDNGTSRIPRRTDFRRLLALVGSMALLMAACGGSTTYAAGAAPTQRRSQAAVRGAPGRIAGYTGPEATIRYSIWGDPAEIDSQTGRRRRLPCRQSRGHRQRHVSDWDTYWDKLQTGIAGGDAPDVFAMDGPLFPDYQSRDVLLDLKPFIDRDGFDLGQLADQAVADFTTAEGQFGLPRDLNVVALYYNKAMFDAASVPYPDETWDWAKLVEVAHSLPSTPTATAVPTNGASTPRRATWRTTGRRWSGRTAATSSRRTAKSTCSARMRPSAGSSSCRT